MFKKIKNPKTLGFTPTPSLTLLHSFLVKFLRNSNYIIKTFFTSFIKRSNKKTTSNWVSGFTLIELLVVIAIIGVLASVVLASLNAAREKGKIASVKSTLKQLYNQASLNQLEKGSFAGSNISYSDLTCTGLKEDGTQGDATTGNLAKIAKSLTDQGIIVKCFSWYGTSSGGVYVGDDNLRFGATALIYDTGELKAWSVDENGVVKWDLLGVTSLGATVSGSDVTMNWTTAQTACATNGGRTPSIEQARTLSHAWRQGSENTTWTPLGFAANVYWSSTPVPSSPSTRSYFQYMDSGYLGYSSQSGGLYVRCVR